MQITTNLKQRALRKAPPAVTALSEEKPSKGETVIKETFTTARSLGDSVGTVTGGALGVAGAVSGAYMGGLGGAATMGLLGLGAGVPMAVMAGKEGLEILGGAFSTAGTLAQAGIVISTVAGAVGGYYVGEKVGYAAGFLPAAAVGMPAGAIGGIGRAWSGRGPRELVNPKENKLPERNNSKFENTMNAAISGLGTLSGAAGGAAIGGLIASGVSLTGGLIARDVAMSAITSSGLVGAGIGAVVGGVLLGVGGYKLVDSMFDAKQSVMNRLERGKEKVELEMTEQELDKKLAGLNEAEAKFADQGERVEAYFKANEQQMDRDRSGADQMVEQTRVELGEHKARVDKKSAQRSSEQDKFASEITYKEENRESIAEQRATDRHNARVEGQETEYQDRKTKYENWESTLDARQTEYDRKEASKESIVDAESTSRRNRTSAQMESSYQSRKGGLNNYQSSMESRQAALDKKTRDMPTLIKNRSDEHYADRTAELKSDLAGVRSGLQSDLDRHQRGLDDKLSSHQGQLDGQLRDHQSRLDSTLSDKRNGLQRTLDNLVRENRSELESKQTNHRNIHDGQERRLDSEYQNQQRQFSSTESALESSVATLDRQVDRLESEVGSLRQNVERTSSEASSTQSRADSKLRDLSGAKSRLEGEARQARSELSSLRSQLSSAKSRLASAQREAASAKDGYQSSANTHAQLEAEVRRLEREIANRT